MDPASDGTRVRLCDRAHEPRRNTTEVLFLRHLWSAAKFPAMARARESDAGSDAGGGERITQPLDSGTRGKT